MRIFARLLVAVLFLQLLGGGTTVRAATSLKIASVSVSGNTATIKWSSPKIAAKESFIVEFTKTGSTPKTLKTKTTAIIAKLDAFSKYTVRISRSSAPKNWTAARNFTVTSPPITGVEISNQTHTSVDVAWGPVVGATSYEVLVDKQPSVSTLTPKINIKNLAPGYTGKVMILPVSGLIKGLSTQPIEFTTLNSAPTKVVVTGITTTGATLSWQAITGADSYNIYAAKKLLANSKTNSYLLAGLLPGFEGSYTVSAVFGQVETLVSESLDVSTLVDTPKKPTLGAITSSGVTASWIVDKNATSYVVTLYESTGTTAVLTNKVNGSLSSTVFSGLQTQTNYTLGIVYIYGEISSKQSELSSFTTLRPAITSVTLSNVTTTSATLNWYPMPGVVTYEVYRDGVLIPAVTAALTVTSVAYSFVGLAPGNTYKFAIRATYLDGTKTTQTTEFVEITQTLLTDPAFAPTSASAPVITLPYASVPIVGATLTASNGLWSSSPPISGYTYQWQRSLDAGSTWANLSGETRSTYKVIASDYAFRLRVRVTATNLNGSTTANSATSSAVAETFNVQIPVVRGTLVSGQLLEVTDGTWSSDYPLTFRYQWSKNGSPIAGEISPSYALTDSDINGTITVSVIANSTLGSVLAESTVRTAVAAAANTVAPVVTGTVRAFSTLTTSDGTWLKSPTITYQWQKSADGVLWNNIASATSATYVVATSDIGFFLRSQVFGARTIVSTNYKYTSPSLATVVVPPLTAVSTSAPVVSGSWTAGSTLSASTGSWTSAGSFTYQWQRSADNSTWSSISSATASTYLLVNDDASKYIRVQVYLTGPSGSDGVAYSVPTAKVGAPYNALAPAISGTQRVGVALSVTTGTWSGSPTYAYQWQTSSDGIAWANVGSATSSSYTPTYTIANLRLRVVVSAINAVDTVTATSQVVQGFLAPIATAIPAISGTVQSGQTLTTDSGTWPSTSSGYAYTWHRSSDGGVSWVNIAGQTGTTYVLVVGDVGYAIRSQVTVTTNAGSSTAYSLPTVAVAP